MNQSDANKNLETNKKRMNLFLIWSTKVKGRNHLCNAGIFTICHFLGTMNLISFFFVAKQVLAATVDDIRRMGMSSIEVKRLKFHDIF